MRKAAMVLGIIGGVVGMVVGFFGYGFAEIWGWVFGTVSEFEQRTGFDADLQAPPDDPVVTKAISIAAPILGIAGGAMATDRATLGGTLLLVSAGGMYYAFGFGVFTMWPIAMCAVAGLLALPAGLLVDRRSRETDDDW